MVENTASNGVGVFLTKTLRYVISDYKIRRCRISISHNIKLNPSTRNIRLGRTVSGYTVNSCECPWHLSVYFLKYLRNFFSILNIELKHEGMAPIFLYF